MSNAPVWLQFYARIEAAVTELKLEVEDTAGYVKLVSPTNDHRIYIQMTTDKLPRIDTTLPLGDLDVGIPLDKPNGRISCHLVPDPALVEQVLRTFMVDPNMKLPKAKRGKKASSIPSLDELLAPPVAAEAPAVEEV